MFNEKALKIVEEAEKECSEVFRKLEDICLLNQKKVLDAYRKSELALSDIASSTGYGNDDRSKRKLSEIYASAFGAETGIVSPLISSGTHALTIALFGLLRPGDTMLSISGSLYDTIQTVIFGKDIGSLADFNIKYEQVELKNNDFDIEAIESAMKKIKPKIIYIQRSRGYSTRDSLSIEKIERVIKEIRKIKKDITVFVDNCYGEFVETKEPCEVGANVAVGSLIKNAGGGIAPTGAYIVGDKACIEQISSRHIAPGIGLEVGSYAGSYTPFFQGFFIAPHTVLGALKGEILFGKVAEKFGIESFPKLGEMPHDIVRTIKFGTEKGLVDFCKIIQSYSPVDSNVTPVPWEMPGYADKVVMAAGAFVQGASIELSCDGPIREPFYCFMQGGLTYEHLKLVSIQFVEDHINE